MAEAMISLRGVSKVFPGATTPAVDRLDLDIPKGEIVVLVGPSGCGKTTTLKMINRVIEPTSGTILIDGEDAARMEPHLLRRRIGYVIQQVGLFPHRTIAQNIGTVPRLLGWDEERIRDRVADLIETVGLDPEMGGRYPAALSGGQQQRAGVARALAADPPVLLMDEPFGAVDPIVRARLQEELLDLQAGLQKTIVFVTHDIDEAIGLGDRVAILNVGGHLEQFARPLELLRQPANAFVASFLGSDRGIRQLSLLPLRDIDLSGGPVVEVGSSWEDVRRTMADSGVAWVAVSEGDRLLGWLAAEEMGVPDVVPATGLRPFASRLDVGANLREALDTVITGHMEYAAVFDGERFVGMLSADRVSEEMRR